MRAETPVPTPADRLRKSGLSFGGFPIPAIVIIAMIMAVSMWLRAGFPVFGIWGTIDDAHFVNLAHKLQSWKWLGTYNPLTLSKGAFFPFFLSFTGSVGLPLKLTEHFLYLLVALLLAYTIMRVSGHRLLFYLVFVVLAFSPLPWMIEGGSRVTREPLYLILTLLVFALAALYLLRIGKRSSLGWALGIFAAFFWLTREEGVWLLPAAFLLGIPMTLRFIGAARGRNWRLARGELGILVSPLIAFTLVVLAVNSINWMKYGVFRNNDFRAGPFAAAYGAIARIETTEWQRYVVFPKEARYLAYQVSPAARELAPYLEGAPGKQWAGASHNYPSPWGCVDRPTQCNTEILSAWFVWALRFGAAEAGHYRSAQDADRFYKRLSREINNACDRREIPCKDRRDSLVPPWRNHYVSDALQASLDVFRTLVGFNRGNIGIPPSLLTREQEEIFARVVHQPLSGTQRETGRFMEMHSWLTSFIARTYASVSLPMFWGALGLYAIMLLSPSRLKSARIPAVAVLFLSALLVAVMTRVVLLGFLEATSIPSNNLLYLMPAVPLYLVFIVMSYGLGIAWMAGFVCNRRATQ